MLLFDERGTSDFLRKPEPPEPPDENSNRNQTWAALAERECPQHSDSPIESRIDHQTVFRV